MVCPLCQGLCKKTTTYGSVGQPDKRRRVIFICSACGYGEEIISESETPEDPPSITGDPPPFEPPPEWTGD